MNDIKITKQDLLHLPDAEFQNADAFKSSDLVVIDSRKVREGCIFVAIKGEKYDGHDFIDDTVSEGASLVIAEKNSREKAANTDIPVVYVDDTIKAFGELAKIWRRKLNAAVVSLTGSNGKTTTKEMISTILDEKYLVYKTEANNNNYIGVPLTILNAQSDCEVLVLEHGTNHFGEIEYTANIAQPDHSAVTNISDSHLEFLQNRKGVYTEKSALLGTNEFNPKSIILNYDDPILRKYAGSFDNVLTYGFDKRADVKGELLGFTKDGKTRLKIEFNDYKIETVLPVYGRANAGNVLSAAAVGIKLGLSEERIRKGINKIKPVDKRLNVKEFEKSMLIDDTYNANPDSMLNALEILSRMNFYSKKIAVLGDMFELGDKSPELHRQLADIIEQYQIDEVLLLGNEMKYLNDELIKKGWECRHFKAPSELTGYLRKIDVSNSAVLVKGSRGMKMEKFVEVIENKDK